MKGNIRQAIDGFIGRHRQEFLPLLAELCRFPSIHGEEAGVQNHIRQKFLDAGYPAKLVPIEDSLKEDPEYTTTDPEITFKDRPNMVVRIPGRGTGRSIILNSHNDVVPAKGWEKAFEPEIRGETIIGRGVGDDKHGAVLQYMIALFLRETGLAPGGDITMEMVIDEEVGGNGSLALIRQGYTADGVIILENSNLNIRAGARGALWFRAEFQGKSAHMAQIHLGVSAIEMALRFVELMKGYQERLRREGGGRPEYPYEPVPAQVNIGTIQGGDWPASVAASCIVEGGVGFLPPRTCADVRREMVEIIASDPDPGFRENVRITYPKLHNDPYEIDANHPMILTLEEACVRSGWRPKVLASIASSDARLFAHAGKMPTVVFCSPRADAYPHSSKETENLVDMLEAFRALICFLEGWCGLD
ncbi:MAG TPA: M20/M25/M40 family metallo-hydrolase [Spirochaetia bacterium]|nr:M20/M25/M40 family metallo-hydrolase [Spirochaetia bacterium]